MNFLCLTAEEKLEVNSHKRRENLQLRSLNSSDWSLWLPLDSPAPGCPCCRTAGWARRGPWLQLGCSSWRWVSSWRLAQLASGQHLQSFPGLLLLGVELSPGQAENSNGSSVQHAAVTGSETSMGRWWEFNLPVPCVNQNLHSCISQTCLLTGAGELWLTHKVLFCLDSTSQTSCVLQ